MESGKINRLYRKRRHFCATKFPRSSQKRDIHVILLLYTWLFVSICSMMICSQYVFSHIKGTAQNVQKCLRS